MKKKNLLMTAIAIFGLATITMAQVPSYVPTSGLVGWWPFNGNAIDESVNTNDGVVTGATLTSDRFGFSNKAYSFNGIDNHIIIPASASLIVDTVTFSCWVKPNSILPFISSIIKKGAYADATNEEYFFGLQAPNTIFSAIKDGTTCTPGIGWLNDLLTSPVNLISNWTNIVYTYSNGTISIFVDGTAQGSTFVGGNITFCSNAEISIGQEFVNHAPFDGVIDDIGFWNRALTQQEISALYNGCSVTVTTQPINQSVIISNNAQFTTASSDPLAAYQWQTDLGVGFQNLNSVGQYSGTSNDTLNVANITMSNNNLPFRCIVSSGSCSDTSNVAVLTVNNNLGINETIQENLFSVFPNPAQSVINVKADSKLIGVVYSIYDNTGRVVLTGKLNSQNTTIELGNLSGGIYMFSVGENMKQTFKVIKE